MASKYSTKKQRPHNLVPTSSAKAFGIAYDVKTMPAIDDGFTGPPGVGFPKPGRITPPLDALTLPAAGSDPLTNADFVAIVTYFQDTVGYFVCAVNGLQFNLDEEKDPASPTPKKLLKRMVEALEDLAGRLGIGTYATLPNNPTELIWPLSGTYIFNYRFTGTYAGGASSFNFSADLKLEFTSDPDTHYCTNCQVIFRITDVPGKLEAIDPVYLGDLLAVAPTLAIGAAPDYISSSSSYLATSSSSYR